VPAPPAPPPSPGPPAPASPAPRAGPPRQSRPGGAAGCRAAPSAAGEQGEGPGEQSARQRHPRRPALVGVGRGPRHMGACRGASTHLHQSHEVQHGPHAPRVLAYAGAEAVAGGPCPRQQLLLAPQRGEQGAHQQQRLHTLQQQGCACTRVWRPACSRTGAAALERPSSDWPGQLHGDAGACCHAPPPPPAHPRHP
jgi:hypothetical protein